MNSIKAFVCCLLLSSAFAAVAQQPALGPGGNGARYATDAYPGFDSEDEIVKPERKGPRWWWWLCGGVKRGTAAEQYALCQELVRDGSYSSACRQLDNLVREWPTAPEALKAQQQLAELTLEKLKDTEEAFREYRYLLDFYSLRCDYATVADTLYKIAALMKAEGKEVMFIRFANTVDVRRAYETCVLRAPGAKWVPEAMLTIAGLREDEGKRDEAVKVYENLRNIYQESDEAKTALCREAGVRRALLLDHGYNRARCRDTIDFLNLALRSCRPDDAAVIRGYLDEALALMEDEAYRSARFYDSSTRTRRSAVSAYERYLAEYPNGAHADEVRARLDELKGEAK